MLVSPEDLRELADVSGAPFQRFVTALVLEEALGCGLKLTDIDADYRTNHPDGGCDIFIAKGQRQFSASVIPDKPSIWSIKAGTIGINPSKLGGELNNTAHRRLRKHLKKGHVYVWCALEPAGQNERMAMRGKADRVAKKLKVDPTLIQFVWIDQLCGFLNNHLNLVGQHLPGLHSVIKPMVTLAQWAEESPDKKGLTVPWVSVPGGKEIQARIKDHLLNKSGDAVLHLAGLSGIGKTRTAIEACRAETSLSQTLYISAFDQIGTELWRRLQNPRLHVRLIIDEVPLEEVTRLQERFAGVGDRIRIVSIGPAPRGQARRQRDPALQQMEPPDKDTAVLPIVNIAGPELEEEVRRSIADFAGNDLRLALLLVEATRKSGQFTAAPLHSYEDVWKRITSRFVSQILDPNHFRELYAILTIAIDVGCHGEHRAELQLLASHFEKSEADLYGAIRDSTECGLGERTQHFFEAKPRALAVWHFQERLWPLLSPRLEEFVAGKPSIRLLRRILERCQETASPFREEVESRVGSFFLQFLGEPDLKLLMGHEASRLYQTWAEFDPERGLRWLEQAVNRASDDDLRRFTGSTVLSGGWGGRRQIVWLCEHLACFAEYFHACERILFRLAQVETEVRIANNSTNTWRDMFLPALANTEVPFPERLDLLNQRLRTATAATINLILSAYYSSIERHFSRIAPPTIVGGRIVPDQWSPKTFQELAECQLSAGKSALQIARQLPAEACVPAVNSVAKEMSRFLNYGLIDDLRNLLMPCLHEESLKRQTLVKLDGWLAWHEREDEGKSNPPWLDSVKRWRSELSPQTLQERIKDLTARDYWSVYQVARRRSDDAKPEHAYSNLAREILHHPEIIEEMRSWLLLPEARSAAFLLFHVGLEDLESKLIEPMLDLFRSAAATHLVASYLGGVQNRAGQLSEPVRETIDKVAQERPGDALHVTLRSDHSERGAQRLIELLPHLEGTSRAMLREISVAPWPSLFSPAQKQTLLQQFCVWAESGDPGAAGIAADIVGMWRHSERSNLSAELAPLLLRLAKLSKSTETAVDDYDWKEILEAIAPRVPQEAAELLADVITDFESHNFQRKEYAQEVFGKLAKDYPDIAMRSIGKWLLDKRRGVIFRISGFRGLFDAIGLPTVKPWVQEHGKVAAIGIARHLNGPRIENGTPIVPELADWLLSAYRNVPEVFGEFAMGRHSGTARWGRARDREAELEEQLKPFESNPKKWVRQWVDYERRSHRSDVELDEGREEEEDRV